MGWLLLLAAILGLLFPPLAVVILAMLILGVFAKGVGSVEDAEGPGLGPRRKPRRHRDVERPGDTLPPPAAEPDPGSVIDVRYYPYPIPPDGQIPLSVPKPPDDLRP